jgi:hypothetical protein
MTTIPSFYVRCRASLGLVATLQSTIYFIAVRCVAQYALLQRLRDFQLSGITVSR